MATTFAQAFAAQLAIVRFTFHPPAAAAYCAAACIIICCICQACVATITLLALFSRSPRSSDLAARYAAAPSHCLASPSCWPAVRCSSATLAILSCAMLELPLIQSCGPEARGAADALQLRSCDLGARYACSRRCAAATQAVCHLGNSAWRPTGPSSRSHEPVRVQAEGQSQERVSRGAACADQLGESADSHRGRWSSAILALRGDRGYAEEYATFVLVRPCMTHAAVEKRAGVGKPQIGGSWTLVDHFGKPVSDLDFRCVLSSSCLLSDLASQWQVHPNLLWLHVLSGRMPRGAAEDGIRHARAGEDGSGRAIRGTASHHRSHARLRRPAARLPSRYTCDARCASTLTVSFKSSIPRCAV
jgi:hypothetical protein